MGTKKTSLEKYKVGKREEPKNKNKKNKLKGRGSRCILICFATYCRLSLYICKLAPDCDLTSEFSWEHFAIDIMIIINF